MRPRRNYDINIIITGKQNGLSGEQVSRKIGGVITSWQVNRLWRDEMAKTKKKGSGGGKKC
jgi:hypothetical protein